jgi:hypothetical protein
MRTCNGVGSGWMSAAQVEAFDRELERLLTERYPAEPLVVKHRIWCAIVRQPRDHALVATNSA